MEKYFYYYVAINYIEGFSDWDTFKVENMNYCFAGCTFLAYHNIENWDVFNGCDNLSLVKCSKETFDELFNAYWWTNEDEKFDEEEKFEVKSLDES